MSLSNGGSLYIGYWLTFSRHWHHIANLVLQDTVERIYAGKLYADVPRGIFLVRGENVLLLGEVVCRIPEICADSFNANTTILKKCRILTAKMRFLPL